MKSLQTERTTPRGWFRWNSTSGEWQPTDTRRTTSKTNWENHYICKVFKPNAMGVSRWVGYQELRDIWRKLCPDNPDGCLNQFGGPGGNGSNFFTRPQSAAAEFIEEKRPDPGRLETRFNGINSNIRPNNQAIPQHVKNIITAQGCAFTGMHNSTIVVDHKDGYHNTQSTSPDDFQPLTAGINKLKGTHCRRCRESNARFDARSLGYSLGWVHGSEQYQGTCAGCFWYDIHYFRSQLVLPPEHEP